MSTTYEITTDDQITSLKKRVFDLEQEEKNIDALNKTFQKLKSDYTILDNQINNLKQIYNQKDDFFNQTIQSLRKENENLQSAYNDRLAKNKNLFAENEELAKQLDRRTVDLCNLQNQCNDLNANLARSLNEKSDLENRVQNLKNINASQDNELAKLHDENSHLNLILQDQNKKLNMLENDKTNLLLKLNQTNDTINDLENQLSDVGNTTDSTKNILDKTNENNMQLSNTIKHLECDCNNVCNENKKLTNNILQEKTLKTETQRQNDQLSCALNNTEKNLNDTNCKYLDMKSNYEQICLDVKVIQLQNDKMKNHANLLQEQNGKLIAELENVKNQDLKMRDLISRKDQTCNLIRNSSNVICQSNLQVKGVLNGKNECCLLNSSQSQYRSNSPKFTYSRENNVEERLI